MAKHDARPSFAGGHTILAIAYRVLDEAPLAKLGCDVAMIGARLTAVSAAANRMTTPLDPSMPDPLLHVAGSPSGGDNG
jgi:hypothetical protein